MRKLWIQLALLIIGLAAFWLGMAATTQVNLVTQVTGLLAVANGGDNTATAAAGTVLAGPASGSPAAFSFRALTVTDSSTISRTRKFAYLMNAILNGTGDNITSVSAGSSRQGATSTTPEYINVPTTATSGNVSSLSGLTSWITGNNNIYQVMTKIGRTTDIRHWAGLTDQTAATMGASDTPTGSWAGFRYSTNVGGETTWQCGTSKAGVNAFIDSTIAADATAFHRFEIDFLDGVPSVAFYIDGALVCTQTDTTKFPATGIPLRVNQSATNLTTTATTFEEAWHFNESDW